MYTAGNPAGAMPDRAPAHRGQPWTPLGALETARTLGLTLPTPAYLFFAIVSRRGTGIAAFRLGPPRAAARPPW